MPNLRDRSAVFRFVTVLPVAALFAAAACSPASPDPADDGRPLVLTTFTVLADMTRNVAGDAVRVESITRVGAEIHGYEPTPDDLVRAQGADLVLHNGLGLEAWFERFTERVDAPAVTLSDGVPTIPIAAGGYEGQANPHAWMSPDNALVYVDNIADALSDLDPAHAEEFAANAASYRAEITDIGDSLRDRLDGLPDEQRALVTCEGAFSYLARDLDLTERYLWPVNADSEGTPRQIADVVTFVRRNEVPAVFCESTVNDGAQRQVARETGAALGGVLYVDSLSDPDGPVPTYLDLLRHDADTIAAGLTGQEGGA
ncbi:metal ABC transporter substrate-binding protein [Marinactinospora rubrisoli]|uniref:Metal ABC transporter substrate-binding protein n=1 Tax=Marinactinospora rubrisoli TaxID=2715399 RepID=A0ABW2KAI2_9ACTN